MPVIRATFGRATAVLSAFLPVGDIYLIPVLGALNLRFSTKSLVYDGVCAPGEASVQIALHTPAGFYNINSILSYN